MNTTNYRYNLDEVSFLRPILIVLVVLYHSMAIHVGSWEMPEGLSTIPAYKAIGRLSYSFMLEAFVFISGYVWAYQRESRGKLENFWKLLSKKIQRLILPAFLFGLIYIILFERDNLTIMNIVEGPGHLWFLPMLFECFLVGWCILSLKISPFVVIPVLFVIAVFRPMDIPFRVSYTMYYLPFFMSGYYIYRKFDWLKKKSNFQTVIVGWVLFFLSYFVIVLLRGWILSKYQSFVVLQVIKEGGTIIYAMIGTLAILNTAVFVTQLIKIRDWYIRIGGLCMGVYIFQQFVIWGLYYKTGFLSLVNEYFAPWIGFTLGLSVSLLCALFIKKTILGKYIL